METAKELRDLPASARMKYENGMYTFWVNSGDLSHKADSGTEPRTEARYSDRVRSMLGPALTVLPKLADGNYDIVFLDIPPDDSPDAIPPVTPMM